MGRIVLKEKEKGKRGGNSVRAGKEREDGKMAGREEGGRRPRNRKERKKRRKKIGNEKKELFLAQKMK
jgi:hypothetical protein